MHRVAVLLLFMPMFVGGQATLSNANIAVTWTAACGISFFGHPDGNNTAAAAAALTWSMDVVSSNATGATTVTSTSATCRGVRLDGERVVAAYTAAVPRTGTVLDVTVVTHLVEEDTSTTVTRAGLISSELMVKVLSRSQGASTVGLWLVGLSIEGIRTSPSARAFLPRGLGVTDWANKTADSLNYPDMSTHVGATMQFLSVDVPHTSSSLYAATHDGAAHTKTLGMPSPSAVTGRVRGGTTTTINTSTTATTGTTTNGVATLSLGYQLTPEGAADPALLANNRTYTVPFPFVVGILPRDGTEGSWYSAAQVYRSWVLGGARWTKPGPILTRTGPKVPSWLLHTDVWINGGRACFGKPLLALNQGDPADILAAGRTPPPPPRICSRPLMGYPISVLSGRQPAAF